jgi:hypothetical protein
MKGVDLRLDPSVTLRIGFLRGRLVPTRTDQPPWFDQKSSFRIEIDSAQVNVTSETIAALLNDHVFPLGHGPFRSIRVEVHPGPDGKSGTLEIKGRLYGFPFRTDGTMELVEGGALRIRTSSVRALGIPVRGAMRLFGLSLEKIVDWKKARGLRAEGNDLVLSPTDILPAPQVRGRLVRIGFAENTLIQVFRASGEVPEPLAIPPTTTRNYMYYRGNTLRFGRLSMTPADLLICDLDPGTPFDFFLDRYNDQLVRGYSQNTATGGLITHLPDYRNIAAKPGDAPR